MRAASAAPAAAAAAPRRLRCAVQRGGCLAAAAQPSSAAALPWGPNLVLRGAQAQRLSKPLERVAGGCLRAAPGGQPAAGSSAPTKAAASPAQRTSTGLAGQVLPHRQAAGGHDVAGAGELLGVGAAAVAGGRIVVAVAAAFAVRGGCLARALPLYLGHQQEVVCSLEGRGRGAGEWGVRGGMQI